MDAVMDSRPAKARRCWAVALVVVGLGMPASAQTPEAAVAHVRILDDVQSLIAGRIPIGLVLGQGESFDTPVATEERGLGKAVTEGREASVTVLSRRWGRVFAVADSGKAVHLKSLRADICLAGLNRKVKSDIFTGTPSEILFAIASSYDPTLALLPPPGVVSAGGQSDERSGKMVTRPLTIATEEGGTLRSALDELAVAASAGWFATERCDERSVRCRCELGVITPSGVLYTTYDGAAGLGPKP